MTADEDWRALCAAIIDDPESDLPRLVYADWLDDHCGPGHPGWPPTEHGSSALAELIRLECALGAEATPPAARDRQICLRRQVLAPLGPPLDVYPNCYPGPRFDRGLLAELSLRRPPPDGLPPPPPLLVVGSVSLDYFHREAFPNGLVVGGIMRMWDCGSTSLPRGLSVAGDLEWVCGQPPDLPPDLRVGGMLSFTHTRLSEEDARRLLDHPGLSDRAKAFGLGSGGHPHQARLVWDRAIGRRADGCRASATHSPSPD